LTFGKSLTVSYPIVPRRRMTSEFGPIGCGPVDRRRRISASRDARSGYRPASAASMPVALQHLDPQLGQNRLGTTPVVIMSTVPFRVRGEPRLQLGEALLGILGLGAVTTGDDAVMKSG